MAKKGKTDRACGYCQKKDGHNARTCQQKKLDAANGVTRSASNDDAVVTSTALVPSAPISRPREESARLQQAHTPHEFEEARKQVYANGTTMTATMRDYAGGGTNIALRFQDEAEEKPTEKVLDIEKTAKLVELLTWGLQKHAARVNAAKALPTARTTTNGLAARQPAAESR